MAGMWDQNHLRMVTDEECTDFKRGSGKVPNPGKRFFLNFASAAVLEVNNQRNMDMLLYARTAMLTCGLARTWNGVWEEGQLFPHLQEIVEIYRDNCNGKTVADSMCLDRKVPESDHETEKQ